MWRVFVSGKNILRTVNDVLLLFFAEGNIELNNKVGYRKMLG
jgi:hypothetical protein